MKVLAEACRALSDPNRLRILRVLGEHSLNVGELATVLDLPQPTVSRQLKALRGVGLVRERREGPTCFLELAEPDAAVAALVADVRAQLGRAGDTEGDDARLAQVMRARRERGTLPVGRHGGFVPGRSWVGWSRALLHLLPRCSVVADVGCGEGGIALELARRAARVIGIDSDPAMLARARAAVAEAGVDNVELIEGDLESMTLEDDSVDLCLFSQVLHHAADPASAIREGARVLRPGGLLLIVDLEPHGQEWVRERLGDRWLGLAGTDLTGWCEAAGLVDIDHQTLPRASRERFTVNVTSGRRPT
jgi:ArsR family transcriptional regulator